MDMYDVYISYRQAERTYEQLLLCDALRARGASVFSDCIQGVPTLRIIEANVPASRLFVFFASPTSLTSKYIRFELLRAVASGRPLLCIVAAGFDVGAWVRAGEAAMASPNAELPLEKAQLDAVVECAKRGVVLHCDDADGAGIDGVVQRVCEEVEATGGGRLFLSQLEALGGPLTPAHLARCAGGALPLAHRADAAFRLAEAAKHRDTHLLRSPPRSAQEVHLLLLSAPIASPAAVDHPLHPSLFLKRALKQRCPDLNVELLPWGAPESGARAAVRAARAVFALLGEPFFEDVAEGARAAFSEAFKSKEKLTVFSVDAVHKVARDGKGLPPGWSEEVEIRPMGFARCSEREASLAEMLNLVGAVPSRIFPKVGVTLAGIKRVLSAPELFPKGGCDNLMGKEVYARLTFALKRHFGEAAVDTTRPFVEIPGLFEPSELGESTCLATYTSDQPFSTALATMEEAPPGTFHFLDPFCLPKYDSLGQSYGISWWAHVKRHRAVLVALPWSFDSPSASWTLRRTWKLTEIALASVEGSSVLFSSPVVSSVARTRIDEKLTVTDLLATDFGAVWTLCSDWALSTSSANAGKREIILTRTFFYSLFPDAADKDEGLDRAVKGRVLGEHEDRGLDRAVKDRVLGELHAHLCAQAEAAVRQLEGLGDAMATHRLPLAYARLLLQPCGRLGSGAARAVQLRDAALAERLASDAARAEQLCTAVLKARAARWAGAAARGDAAAAEATGADALFAAASLAAAGAACDGGARDGGSGWSRVVGALPPALAAAFGAVLEPAAALRGAASSEAALACAAAGGGGAQKRVRVAAPGEAAGAPPPSSLPPCAGALFTERNRKVLQSLEKDLRSGSVVLFTGAGFFGPTNNEEALPKELALPDWKTLMQNLVRADTALPEGVRVGLKALLESQSSGAAEYEMVAQQLEDAMKRAPYEAMLKKMLTYDPSTHGGVMKRTFALTRLLPFRALLTTNFTRTHKGHDASMVADDCDIPRASVSEFVSPRACWSVEKSLAAQLAPAPDVPAVELRREEKLLRCAFDIKCDPSKPLPFLDGRFDAKMLHLHGTQKAVSSRRSYRELLYSNSNILPFLRTLAATSKFLFIGYSLADAYFCEILQETLALLAPPGEAAKRPCLGYFFQWCPAKEGNEAQFYSEALLAKLDYRRKHQGLRTVLTLDASVELQALLGASKEVRFARAFEGVHVLALAPLDPSFRFEEAALAVASLAFAATETTAAVAGDGGEFAAAERAFRQQRDDFSALSAALGRLQLPPPTARPKQWLPLPRGGSFLICFSVDQLAQALAAGTGRGPWTILLSDWRLEKTAGGVDGVLRGLRLGAAPALLPALAFIANGPSGGDSGGSSGGGSGGGGNGAAAAAAGSAGATEEWEAMSRGYLRLCRGFEELLSSLSELLQRYNPT